MANATRDQRLVLADVVKNIDDAVLGSLNIPEFQRKFVWTPEKTKKFVDSLWRKYPVGALLLWESKYDSPRTAEGGAPQKLWIIDGQQRITSLALLFGKKPYWWDDSARWNKYLAKFDVLADISQKLENMEFSLPNPVRSKSPSWISVRKVLASKNLSELAEDLTDRVPKSKFSDIHQRLESLKEIASFPIFEIIIDHELEDVAEIFSRLNTAGTKIRESDVIIALVAARQQGWVRDSFDPFLKDLETKGFDVDPSILIRSLGVIGTEGTARLRDIPDSFWSSSSKFEEAWDGTKRSISYVVKHMGSHGILSSDVLPSHNALIPLFVMKSEFEESFRFKQAFRWFLLATIEGRYSGSAITTLDQDVKTIYKSDSPDEVLEKLVTELDSDDFEKEDFLQDYRDGDSIRLVQYLICFENEAMDWLNPTVRIGYDNSDNELNEGFKPEWHHFFPKKVLRDADIDDSDINSLANIVILNEKANRTFTSKYPDIYLEKYEVSRKRLDEQFIPDWKEFEVSKYEEFLNERSSILARAANKYMKSLQG